MRGVLPRASALRVRVRVRADHPPGPALFPVLGGPAARGPAGGLPPRRESSPPHGWRIAIARTHIEVTVEGRKTLLPVALITVEAAASGATWVQIVGGNGFFIDETYDRIEFRLLDAAED